MLPLLLDRMKEVANACSAIVLIWSWWYHGGIRRRATGGSRALQVLELSVSYPGYHPDRTQCLAYRKMS